LWFAAIQGIERSRHSRLASRSTSSRSTADSVGSNGRHEGVTANAVTRIDSQRKAIRLQRSSLLPACSMRARLCLNACTGL
jgi:hypothetical protein